MMMLRPGVSVAWYLPRRSTTQAFCCGTTFTPWMTKITTITARTAANSIVLFSFSDLFQDEAAAVDVAHAVQPRALRRAAGRHRGPDRAAVAHRCGLVGGPCIHVHVLAGIEVQVGAGHAVRQ